MTVITYRLGSADSHTVELKDQQTVLEGLTDSGLDIPSGCRAGACQACKLQATAGALPAVAQQGLSNAEKTMGYFLSCLCRPHEDLVVTAAQGQRASSLSTVLEIKPLSAQVLRLRLSAPFEFYAGQYVTVLHQGQFARSYSIASNPQEGVLELHIKKIPGGLFSCFAFEQLRIGDTLELQGPMGNCIYAAPSPDQPLLLVGLGTGLAPLYGIIKQAVAQGHSGAVHLIAAARSQDGLYLMDELRRLTANHQNLTVDFVIQDGEAIDNVTIADVYQLCRQLHPSTKGYGIYLCGAPSFVQKLKKQCFLAGASMADIQADPFLPCS